MSKVQSITGEYRNPDILVKRQTDNNYRNTDCMDTTERTPFGRRLFESREAAELTQDQVAAKIGMSQGTLGEAETSGQRSGYTPQLAALYKVDPVWLATGRTPTEKPLATPARDTKPARPLIQDLMVIADTINDIGLKKLLPIVKDYAAMHPVRKPRQKRAKAA